MQTSEWVDDNHLQFNIQKCKYTIHLWQSEKANRPDIPTFIPIFKLWKLIPYVYFTCASPSWVCEPSLEPLQNWWNQLPGGCAKICFKNVCKTLGWYSYDDVLQLFSLPSLQQCRLYLDLFTMFKIVHGLFYFPSGVFVEHASSQSYKVTVTPTFCLSISESR